MKRIATLLVLTLLSSMYSCKNSTNFDPTVLVQTSLNNMQTGRYAFPDTKTLILVKDDYSAHLRSLYYGKNKLILKAVPKQMLKYSHTPGDDTTKMYITTHYERLKRDYVFVSIELNHNRTFRFYFRSHENMWKIESSFVDIH